MNSLENKIEKAISAMNEILTDHSISGVFIDRSFVNHTIIVLSEANEDMIKENHSKHNES